MISDQIQIDNYFCLNFSSSLILFRVKKPPKQATTMSLGYGGLAIARAKTPCFND